MKQWQVFQSLKVGIPVFFICTVGLLYGETGSPRFSIESSIQWDTRELVSIVRLDMTSAGLGLPTGRAHGEELLDREFSRLVAPFLFSIPVDSSTTIETKIQQGLLSILDLSILDMDTLAGKAHRSAAILDLENNSLQRTVTIQLTDLSTLLVRHRLPASLPRPLIPQGSREYTGLIIFAQEVLPIHGRQGTARLTPCLFPKIWDSDMTLIYELNVVDPDIAKSQGIVRYTTLDRVLLSTPSGIGPELQDLVGERPLRILPDKVFGRLPTDPVISKTDAQILLSSDHNRRLLTEGRVVMVIAPELLVQRFTDGVPPVTEP